MDTTGRIVSIPFSEFQRPANTNLAMKSLGFNKANVCQLSFIVRSSASQAGSGVYYLDDIKGVNMEK